MPQEKDSTHQCCLQRWKTSPRARKCGGLSRLEGFPGGSAGREPTCNAGDPRDGFDPGVGKIPRRKKWQPAPVLLPEKSHARRSRVGYSPKGGNELDMAERTHCGLEAGKTRKQFRPWSLQRGPQGDPRQTSNPQRCGVTSLLCIPLGLQWFVAAATGSSL